MLLRSLRRGHGFESRLFHNQKNTILIGRVAQLDRARLSLFDCCLVINPSVVRKNYIVQKQGGIAKPVIPARLSGSTPADVAQVFPYYYLFKNAGHYFPAFFIVSSSSSSNITFHFARVVLLILYFLDI